MQIACIGLSVMDLLVGLIEKVMNINQNSQQDTGKVTHYLHSLGHWTDAQFLSWKEGNDGVITNPQWWTSVTTVISVSVLRDLHTLNSSDRASLQWVERCKASAVLASNCRWAESRRCDGICLRKPFNMNFQWSDHNQIALDSNNSMTFVTCSPMALNI